MAARARRFGAVLILFAAVPFLVFMTMESDGEGICKPLPDDNWQNGDVLLLGSTTWRGRLLKMLDTQPDYLHIGLIDKSDGECHLIHADPQHDCVIRERLDEYFASNRVGRALLLRVKCDKRYADTAIEFARAQATMAREFDHTFRYGEGSGLYCTELVLQAWATADVELIPNVGKGDRIFPSRILKSDYICPIIEYQGCSAVVLCDAGSSGPNHKRR